jgi:[protein-PII] uridylyltransferase
MIKVKFGNRGLEELIKRKYLTEQESKSYSDAYSFLLRVRNELHFLSKRPVDTLHLEKQPEVALGLGYDEEDIFRRVEIFMGDYYSHARTISQITGILEQRLVYATSGTTSKLSFRKVLSAYRAEPTQHVDGFELLNNKLSSPNSQIFDDDPERILRLFRHSQRLSATLSPDLRSSILHRLM